LAHGEQIQLDPLMRDGEMGLDWLQTRHWCIFLFFCSLFVFFSLSVYPSVPLQKVRVGYGRDLVHSFGDCFLKVSVEFSELSYCA
jgi:hypothetical protein